MTVGTLCRRIWYLINRSRLERELEAEMAAHREMMGDPRRFGNALKLREESRDAWGWGWLDRAWQDVRYGARALRRDRGFTVVAALILSAGVGLNATFFHVLNVAALRPPAIKAPIRSCGSTAGRRPSIRTACRSRLHSSCADTTRCSRPC